MNLHSRFRTALHATLWCSCLGVCLFLAACNNPPGDSPEEQIQSRLVGHWLRDYEEDGVHARRLLVLESDGHFSESVRVVDAAGAVTEHAHVGEWTFDGTNLKRRYTLTDGKRRAAPSVPFATYEIRFESIHEFVGRDNVHQRELRYRRVDSWTQP